MKENFEKPTTLDEILEEFKKQCVWDASLEEQREDLKNVASKVAYEYNLRVKDNPDTYLANRHFARLVKRSVRELFVGTDKQVLRRFDNNNDFRRLFTDAVRRLLEIENKETA